MYYVRYPLSSRHVEDILSERGVDICHETVWFWAERFGSKFAREIRKNCQTKRAWAMQGCFLASPYEKTLSIQVL